MSKAQQTDGFQAIGDREVAALTESMTVVDWIERARDAPGLFEVYTQSGSQYLVDLEMGVCECPDARYRNRECKHLKRVQYEVGDMEIPSWVDPENVDKQLGRHVRGGEPKWAGRPAVVSQTGP